MLILRFFSFAEVQSAKKENNNREIHYAEASAA